LPGFPACARDFGSVPPGFNRQRRPWTLYESAQAAILCFDSRSKQWLSGRPD